MLLIPFKSNSGKYFVFVFTGNKRSTSIANLSLCNIYNIDVSLNGLIIASTSIGYCIGDDIILINYEILCSGNKGVWILQCCTIVNAPYSCRDSICIKWVFCFNTQLIVTYFLIISWYNHIWCSWLSITNYINRCKGVRTDLKL